MLDGEFPARRYGFPVNTLSRFGPLPTAGNGTARRTRARRRCDCSDEATVQVRTLSPSPKSGVEVGEYRNGRCRKPGHAKRVRSRVFCACESAINRGSAAKYQPNMAVGRCREKLVAKTGRAQRLPVAATSKSARILVPTVRAIVPAGLQYFV